MYIEPFHLDEWMIKNEGSEKYNLDHSCVYALTLNEMDELCGLQADNRFLDSLRKKKLGYGDNATGGSAELRECIAGLYDSMQPEDVIVTFGGEGARHQIFFSLVDPGDEVIVIVPGYQPLWSLPKAMGATVKLLHLRKEDQFKIDADELNRLITPKTKMICLSNPSNPMGTVLDEKETADLIEAARKCGAYIMSDEVYRYLGTDGTSIPSLAEQYEKGISIGSMTEAFALAGLSTGWICTHDQKAKEQIRIHYPFVMEGNNVLSESISTLAIRYKDILLKRNLSILQANRESLDSWMHHYDKYFSYVRPFAGTMALVYYSFDIPSVKFCEDILKNTGTLVMPGDVFGEPYSIRINYACYHRQLMGGLHAVGKYVERLDT